ESGGGGSGCRDATGAWRESYATDVPVRRAFSDEGFGPSLRLTPTATLLHRYPRKDLHGPPSAPVGEFPSHARSAPGVGACRRLLWRPEVGEAVRPGLGHPW